MRSGCFFPEEESPNGRRLRRNWIWSGPLRWKDRLGTCWKILFISGKKKLRDGFSGLVGQVGLFFGRWFLRGSCLDSFIRVQKYGNDSF